MTRTNHQWLINARPNGRALQDGDFLWNEGEVAAPKHGEVLVKVEVLGFDPAQKGWMENVANYAAPTNLGDVMRASGVGEVVESADPRFAPGDKVSGQVGWQEYATVPGHILTRQTDDEFLTANLSVLGNTGLTALFGMNKIGKPFPGDTLVVTGAAGATGSVAGQIGKIAGCRVIGIAGGEAKCRWLTDSLKFDAAIDYKAGDVKAQLRELAPNGIDIIWDNVGGPMLDDLMARIATHARVVICGGIARYEAADLPPGPTNYFNLVFQRATMQGLLLTEYNAEFAWGRKRLKSWLQAGQLRYREDWQTGLENAPATLSRLFSGDNLGKQLLRVA